MKTRFTIVALVAFSAAVSLTALGLIAAQSDSPAAAQTKPRDGVFVHLSQGVEDPHRSLMALRMAQLMAEDKDVLVYFDIQGIQHVLKNAQDLDGDPFGSSQSMIRDLIDKGATLMVCPGCLGASDNRPEDVREGVQIADKETFFNFTEGRILTLDY